MRRDSLDQPPQPATVTNRIITSLVENPYKPLFATVSGWGVDPNTVFFLFFIFKDPAFIFLKKGFHNTDLTTNGSLLGDAPPISILISSKLIWQWNMMKHLHHL